MYNVYLKDENMISVEHVRIASFIIVYLELSISIGGFEEPVCAEAVVWYWSSFFSVWAQA